MSDRTKIVIPRLNPNLATQQAAARVLGTRTQKSQDVEVERIKRASTIPTVRTTFQSHWWFRDNIGVGVDQSGLLAIPSGSGTMSSNPRNQMMASSGKIIGGFLELGSSWTAGRIWLGIMFDDSLEEELEDVCVIDGTGNNVCASFVVPYENGYDFEEGALIRAAFSTSSDWPNTTTEVRGSFLIAYD